jgi:tyrosinase
MLDTTAPHLDYTYEDVSDPLGGATRVAVRLFNLGRPVPPEARSVTEVRMGRSKPAQMIGANDGTVMLVGKSIAADVVLDKEGMERVRASFAPRSGVAAAEPDRVFLNLENIRGGNDGVLVDVYVGVPEGAAPEAFPDRRVGTVSLFGISAASSADAGHGANGLTKVLEITHVVDALQLARPDLDKLDIRFVPRQELLPGDGLSIDRVSVFRQGL